MSNRIVYYTERINTIFLSLEVQNDCSEYCVAIDGEVIVWNDTLKEAIENYELIKENIKNKRYVRMGLE